MRAIENALIFPAPRFPEGDWQPADFRYEDVHFESADGTALHGWYLEAARPRAHVVYYHGNGEHVAFAAPYLAALRNALGISIFVFDYRGYGRSQGKASEQGVYRDAEAAVQWLAARAERRASALVHWGRSIGGVLAIDRAVAHQARGLIVENSFPSIRDVAAHLFQWLPVRWLMRSRFPAGESIQAYHGPLLQSHAEQDTLVPLRLGERLYAACPSATKQFLRFPELGHNDPPPEFYYPLLDDFLDRLPPES